MKYAQVVPAMDWFVVSHKDADQHAPYAVTRIVAWGFDDGGEASALIPHYSNDKDKDKAVLVAMEFGATKLKHLSSLNKKELDLAKLTPIV